MDDLENAIAVKTAEQRKILERLDIPSPHKRLALNSIKHITENLQCVKDVIAYAEAQNVHSAEGPDKLDGCITESGSEVQPSDDISADEGASHESYSDEIRDFAKQHGDQLALRARNNEMTRKSGRLARPKRSFIPGISFLEDGDSPQDDPEYKDNSTAKTASSDVDEGEVEDGTDEESDEAEQSVADTCQEGRVHDPLSIADESFKSKPSATKAHKYHPDNREDSKSNLNTEYCGVTSSIHPETDADSSEPQDRRIDRSDTESSASASEVTLRELCSVEAAENAPELSESGMNANELTHNSENERVIEYLGDDRAYSRQDAVTRVASGMMKQASHPSAKRGATAIKPKVSEESGRAQHTADRERHGNELPLRQRTKGPVQQTGILLTSNGATKRFSEGSDNSGPRKQAKLGNAQPGNVTSDPLELEAVLKEVFKAQNYCEAYIHGDCCTLRHLPIENIDQLLFPANKSFEELTDEEKKLLELDDICSDYTKKGCCNMKHETAEQIFDLLDKADKDLAACFASSLTTGLVNVPPLFIQALRTLGICVGYYSARYHGNKYHCKKRHVSIQKAESMIAMPDAHQIIKLRVADELELCRTHLGHSKSNDERRCCNLRHPDPLKMTEQVHEYVEKHLHDYDHSAHLTAAHNRADSVLRALRAL